MQKIERIDKVKVVELIEALKKYDPNLEVYEDYEGCHCEIDEPFEVKEDRLYITEHN